MRSVNKVTSLPSTGPAASILAFSIEYKYTLRLLCDIIKTEHTINKVNYLVPSYRQHINSLHQRHVVLPARLRPIPSGGHFSFPAARLIGAGRRRAPCSPLRPVPLGPRSAGALKRCNRRARCHEEKTKDTNAED